MNDNVTFWTVEQDGKVTRHISIADIEKLQAENANLREQDQIISQEIKTYIQIAGRLQTENKKLREALVYIAKVYDRPTDMKVKARHILAELDKDNNDK